MGFPSIAWSVKDLPWFANSPQWHGADASAKCHRESGREGYHRLLMRIARFLLLVLFGFTMAFTWAQGTAPTFRYNAGHTSVTLPGRDPAQGGSTVIPTVLVPVRLQFDSKLVAGKALSLDARADVPRVLRSPVFAKAPFG